MKTSILTAACLMAAAAAQAAAPIWFEPDSAAAIHARIQRDFPYSTDEFLALVQQKRPTYTMDSLRHDIDKHYVETLVVDGTERVFRKAPGNMRLLDPAISGPWKHRGSGASARRISYVDSILRHHDGTLADGGAHRVRYNFSIDVPYDEAIAGDTLRVWMPFPVATQRQSDIKLISTSQPDFVLSDGRSVHSSIYFQAPAPAPGDTAHFDYTAEFVTRGEYFPPEYILANLKPYDKKSDLYRRYTAMEDPHIIRLDSLAHAVAGGETNPFLVSEKVYNYIITAFPWAGAREYSTIDCIPAYVLEQGHGDCGQVSLLYISMMRTLGIPARWESGWMLHPGEKNLHDWAEVYFEGIGWVPVDTSFGRYTTSDDPRVQTFYSHGMDSHRLAANQGVHSPFYPAKRFVRSESVDAQMGEVETTRGNLFYPMWDLSLKLISVTPVNTDK